MKAKHTIKDEISYQLSWFINSIKHKILKIVLEWCRIDYIPDNFVEEIIYHFYEIKNNK